MHMFTSIAIGGRAARWIVPVLLAACIAPPVPASAAELLMLEQPGCVWCQRFNEEIAPAYARTDEGKRAPLRRVDITKDWPADLAHIRKERLTPTFILTDGGIEIDRMRGYAGDQFFWSLLDEMVAKLPGNAETVIPRP